MPALLPTSALAPPGARTVVLAAGAPAAFPTLDAGGTTLYAIDFAQISEPGDPAIQVDLQWTPQGLVGDIEAAIDQATILLYVTDALTAGAVVITPSVVFASGASLRLDVTLPVAPGTPLAPIPPGCVTVNGFALAYGGVTIP